MIGGKILASKIFVAATAVAAAGAGTGAVLVTHLLSNGVPQPTAIAVLGDSYASGEGTSPGDGSDFIQGTGDGTFADPVSATNPDNCHRSSQAYAVTIFHASTFFVACSGSNISDMTTLQKDGTTYRSDGPLTQVDRLTSDVKTVIVSVGGDDAGFSTVLTACTTTVDSVIPIHSASACQPAIDTAEKGFSGPNGIESNLIGLYLMILAKAPRAHIYAVGYPYLFPPGGFNGCNGITPANQVALNAATDALNAVISRAATELGSRVTFAPGVGSPVTFVNVSGVMEDHWICGNSFGTPAWINDLQFSVPVPQALPFPHFSYTNCTPRNITSYLSQGPFGVVLLGVCSQSFHPTADGSHALGEKILLCINDPSTCRLGQPPAPKSSPPPPTAPSPGPAPSPASLPQVLDDGGISDDSAVRPALIEFYADGKDALSGLSWSSWTAAAATGTGNISLPAMGTTVTIPVTVALSRPWFGSSPPLFTWMVVTDQAGQTDVWADSGEGSMMNVSAGITAPAD